MEDSFTNIVKRSARFERINIVPDSQIGQNGRAGRENRSAAGSELAPGGREWESDKTGAAEEVRSGDLEGQIRGRVQQLQYRIGWEEEDIRPSQHKGPGTPGADRQAVVRDQQIARWTAEPGESETDWDQHIEEQVREWGHEPNPESEAIAIREQRVAGAQHQETQIRDRWEELRDRESEERSQAGQWEIERRDRISEEWDQEDRESEVARIGPDQDREREHKE